ncbi:MAG TPA: gliding motility-associated C-terminal domain-containing protein [Edaphocola sp.]|nr:gliding motility-associated C-terminal domain-containing protein [Edaphocola sp.]
MFVIIRKIAKSFGLRISIGMFVIALILMAYGAYGQTFNYFLSGNPISTTGWITSAQSYVNGGEFVLTDPQPTQAGYIYYATPQNLANCSRFTVTFDFKISQSSSPTADGIAFWYISNPPTGFINGGGLGLPSYPDGLVLLLDTYNNNGLPDDNPLVSLRRYDGTVQGYVEGSTTGQITPDVTYQNFIADTGWHTCKLIYSFGTVSVGFDNNPPIMTGTTVLSNITGYFGFSASTGALWSEQVIKNVSISGAPDPIPPVVDSIFYCQNSPAVPLSAEGDPGTQINWYISATGGAPLSAAPTPNTAVPGTYIWYVSEAVPECGLESDRAPVVVTVKPLPEYSLYDTICPGSAYNFYGEELYEPGTYSTTRSSSDSTVCDSLITLYLSAGVFPDLQLDPSPQILFCQGDSVLLKLTNPVAGADYKWYLNDIEITGLEDMNTCFVSAPGIYQVIGDLNGCIDTSGVVQADVSPAPVAGIVIPEDDNICTLDTLMLQAEGDDGYEYEWSPENVFNPGGGATGKVVYGIFSQLQTKVMLTAYNEYNCVSRDSIIIQTHPCCDIFVPTAFSPNGDGTNDRFFPELQPGQKLLEFSVYDRWGKMVYHTASGNQGWGGAYPDGQAAGSGTYMYYMAYTCPNGTILYKRGDVTLIR